MDIVFIVTWKNGIIKEFVIENSYLPNLISVLIEIIRSDDLEKMEIMKRKRIR